MCRPARSDSHLGAAVTVVAVATVAAAIAAGVAALAGVAFIVIRLHRRQAWAMTALPSSRVLSAGQPVAAIPAPRLLAIEAPRQSAAEALGLEEEQWVTTCP